MGHPEELEIWAHFKREKMQSAKVTEGEHGRETKASAEVAVEKAESEEDL